jgi:hypothetical protein
MDEPCSGDPFVRTGRAFRPPKGTECCADYSTNYSTGRPMDDTDDEGQRKVLLDVPADAISLVVGSWEALNDDDLAQFRDQAATLAQRFSEQQQDRQTLFGVFVALAAMIQDELQGRRQGDQPKVWGTTLSWLDETAFKEAHKDDVTNTMWLVWRLIDDPATRPGTRALWKQVFVQLDQNRSRLRQLGITL